MGLLTRSSDDVVDETMPQTVPSAGFTPPCDYSTFAENFDLSLLPSGDPLSPSTQFYTQSPPPPYEESIKSKQINITEPKIFTTFYPNDEDLLCQSDHTLDFRPDFQKLLESETEDTSSFGGGATGNIYLEVPQNNFLHPNSPCGSLSPYSTSLLSPNDQFTQYRTGDGNFYPSSPEVSLYAPSPNSVYSRSPCGEEFLNRQYSPLPSLSPFTIKEENYLSPSCGGVFSSPNSPCNSYSNISSPSDNTLSENQPDVLGLLNSAISNKSIKQEGDFGSVLNEFQEKCLQEFLNQTIKSEDSKPKDHKLLREALRDTSFQKKFNIKPVDFGLIEGQIKMEEPDPDSISNPEDLISSCNEQIARENIEPVLNLAIEQMRKDVNATCSVLGISSDPMKWSPENVLSWVQWTCREFGMSDPMPEQWNISGSNLVNLDEQDFSNRSPQGGMILYAQLEIWKAACCEEDLGMQWLPDTTSSNASSGDVTDDEDEETSPQIDAVKPTTSARPTGSHIHLWQFLKELLASSQNYGSCIRWLDRSKGIFKIEDSVKVARLWGKRKNRPAMNYDKLSRSIRQYYKKGIMKKTERSQRLVYQFCHPYNL